MFAARSTCRILKLHSVSGRQQLSGGGALRDILALGRVRAFQQKSSSNASSNTPAAAPNLLGIRVLWGKIFGKYLLATNVLSSGLLMVIGDVAAQEIEKRRGFAKHDERYDWPRIGRMFLVGALQGPMHHYVYMWMDRIMPVANLRNTLWKILIDQVVMSPACILTFFYCACALERKSLQETNDELCRKFPFIYVMDWMLWPGAQYVNFRYLDIKYRVMFVNVCTAMYNVLMSYVKHDFENISLLGYRP